MSDVGKAFAQFAPEGPRFSVWTFGLSSALPLFALAGALITGAPINLPHRVAAAAPPATIRSDGGVQLTAFRPGVHAPASRTAAAPPGALQAQLQTLAADYREPVGIAVSEVGKDWIASVNGDRLFPQQSVSKMWTAVAVFDAVDQGRLRLDDPVVMGEADRSVFYQPVSMLIGPNGYHTTVAELLRRALEQSDNAANDKLMQIVGGPKAVSDEAAAVGGDGIRVAGAERDLQARIAGMTWQPGYGVGQTFKDVRARLPAEHRDAAMQRYLDDPYDGAAPAALVRALSALQEGKLVSPASRDVFVGLMGKARTGPNRLKGGLPEGWTIAHKTGTGQDWRGASVGINDIALITAPDGKTYSVAVMIARTKKPVPQRLAFMQGVTKAVVDHWAAERGKA